MSIETEQEFLACLIGRPSLLKSTLITVDEFEFQEHKEIYSAMREIEAAELVPDIVELGDHMRQSNNQAYQLAKDILKRCYGHHKQFSQHEKRMVKATQGRNAAYIATSLLENLSSGSASVSIEKAIIELSALNTVKKKHSHTLKDGLVEFYGNVNDAFESKGIMGVSTGIHELDVNLGGFNKSDLIIIQARSGMGKTALMLNMAYAPTGKIGIISAEQGVNQAAGRMLAFHGNVDAQRMRTGRMRPSDLEDFNRAFRTLNDMKGESVFFNDEPSISVHAIKRQARQWKAEHDIEALYVDYVQKLDKPDPKMNKFESVSVNVGMLKDLARELNIPVIVLAQTKREVDQRPNKRPGPADVSDSSDIEKEADVFISLYREDRYENDHTLHTGEAELIICKNRHGPCGTIMTRFEGSYMKFVGLKDKDQEGY